MGLFGGISGSKSSSSSSKTYTPWDENAVNIVKAMEAAGVDLTNLLKGTTGAQQEYETQAFGRASKNLADSAPVMTEMFNQALKGNDPTEAANKASTDVMAAFDTSNAAWKREMARYGINPAGFASTSRGAAMDQATAEVGARAEAEQNAKDANFTKLVDAVGANNQTNSILSGYNAAGAQTSAIGATTGAAQVGLTPKQKQTRQKEKTSGLSGGFGFE